MEEKQTKTQKAKTASEVAIQRFWPDSPGTSEPRVIKEPVRHFSLVDKALAEAEAAAAELEAARQEAFRLQSEYKRLGEKLSLAQDDLSRFYDVKEGLERRVEYCTGQLELVFYDSAPAYLGSGQSTAERLDAIVRLNSTLQSLVSLLEKADSVEEMLIQKLKDSERVLEEFREKNF